MAKTKPTAASSAQKRLAAERAAAARQRIQAAQRRRRLLTVAAALGAIVAVVAVLIVVKVVEGDNSPKSGTKTVQASAAVATRVAGVPASVFDQVGVSGAAATPKKTTGAALTGAGGLPRVLFVGGEFCPYCAAERWPLAVALSRFGTFTGLGETTSSPSDVYPSTATLSFHGATYTSKYLAFTGKELETNQVVDGNYSSLDTITGADKALFEKNGSSFPYLNVGGRWLVTTAEYDPATLKGLTQLQIATELSDSSSAVAKAVITSANLLTADLCTLTKGAPAAVCTSSGVEAAAAKISGNGG